MQMVMIAKNLCLVYMSRSHDHGRISKQDANKSRSVFSNMYTSDAYNQSFQSLSMFKRSNVRAKWAGFY